jgi:hypothetical protein
MTLRAMVDAKASLRDVLAEADGDALRQCADPFVTGLPSPPC